MSQVFYFNPKFIGEKKSGEVEQSLDDCHYEKQFTARLKSFTTGLHCSFHWWDKQILIGHEQFLKLLIMSHPASSARQSMVWAPVRRDNPRALARDNRPYRRTSHALFLLYHDNQRDLAHYRVFHAKDCVSVDHVGTLLATRLQT